MAPVVESGLLPRQQNCDYINNGTCYSYSSWYWWGRWVFLGVVVLAVVAIMVILGCVTNRRRRRRGLNPYYGTGWMGPAKYGPPQSGAPPPEYSARPMPNQYTDTAFTPSNGYYGHGGYGGQDQGIQLQQPQQPQHSYYPAGGPRGGDDVYSAPAGPPPSKIS